MAASMYFALLCGLSFPGGVSSVSVPVFPFDLSSLKDLSSLQPQVSDEAQIAKMRKRFAEEDEEDELRAKHFKERLEEEEQKRARRAAPSRRYKDVLTTDIAEAAAESASLEVEKGCEPAGRKMMAQQLYSLFLHSWAGEMMRSFEGIKAPVYLVLVEGRTEALFRNWMAHFAKLEVPEESYLRVVAVSLDEPGTKACTDVHDNLGELRAKVGMRCANLTGWLPPALFQSSKSSLPLGIGSVTYGESAMDSCARNFILWSKPHILEAAVRMHPQGVLMVDTDVILHKDLLPYARKMLQENKRATIVTAEEPRNGARDKWGLNVGTVFAQGPKSEKILEGWAALNEDFLQDPRGDQAALEKIFESNFKKPGYEEFHKQLYKMRVDMVGQCAVKGEYATHYNCFRNKKWPMQQNGNWVEEADNHVEEEDITLDLHIKKRQPNQASPLQYRKKIGGSVEADLDFAFSSLHKVSDKIMAMKDKGDWIV